MPEASRIAGHALVQQLVALGADTVFCVPGESFLGVLDGLYEAREHVRVVTNRQEGGAAMMASAYGQLTGRPGVAMVTRGPGATNASIGVHMADQDANPMLLFVGQVPLGELDRRSFQEVDYRLMFAGIAKEVVEIRDPHRVPEYVARAWRTAVTGEPGPVIVVLPEDMLRMETTAPVVPPSPPLAPAPAPESVAAIAEALAAAERPLVVVGGSAWSAAGVRALAELVQHTGLPFATAFRRQDLVDNTLPGYVGGFGPLSTAGLSVAAREADVVLLLGTRPDEQTAAGWLDDPVPAARVLQVHPAPGLIGKLLPIEIGVVADPGAFAQAWQDLIAHGGPVASASAAWRARLRANLDHVRSGATGARLAADCMTVLNELLPADAVLTVGAGAYTFWAQRLHDLRHLSGVGLGGDGLWPARGGDGQTAAPGAGGRGVRRRRLFPDERAGTRDRRPEQAGPYGRRDQQRDVRCHSRSPAAGVPRPAGGDCTAQPGLRGARSRVRRFWCHRRDTRGTAGRVGGAPRRRRAEPDRDPGAPRPLTGAGALLRQ